MKWLNAMKAVLTLFLVAVAAVVMVSGFAHFIDAIRSDRITTAFFVTLTHGAVLALLVGFIKDLWSEEG